MNAMNTKKLPRNPWNASNNLFGVCGSGAGVPEFEKMSNESLPL